MKKTLAWGLLACLTVGLLASFIVRAGKAAAPSAFYYAYSTKIPLIRTPDQVVIRYKALPASIHVAETLFQKLAVGSQVHWHDAKTAIITTAAGQGLNALLTLAATNGEVHTSQPVYRFETGATFAVTDEFNVQFLPTATDAQIAALAQKTKSTALWSPIPGVTVMSVAKGGDALAAANLYQESGLVVFAHPNFLTDIVLNQAPNDTYYPRQFYLKNTGQIIAVGIPAQRAQISRLKMRGLLPEATATLPWPS